MQNYTSLFDIHADDFGISKNSCDDIIKLIDNKMINSISILSNMHSFSYAVDLLKQRKESINSSLKISVHLNFMEGHCCSNKEAIPSLVDNNGYFKISWGKLFIFNYIPFVRKAIKKQLTTEIISQTKKCIDTGVLNNSLRFDGHQHTHMIPLVFEALYSAVKYFETQGIHTEFIRNTEDPIKPYFKAKNIKNTFAKINIIKCLILNYYSLRIKNKLSKMNLNCNYLCGVFFSGNMDFLRLSKVLPYYVKKPSAQNRIIELLFHPGSVLKEEITEEFVKPGFNEFHLSNGRKIEYSAIEQINSTGYLKTL